ncbi:guanylate kinase [bacterium]|nr:guanylate kinase [bacterium]
MAENKLLVFSSPSGGGKSTIIKRILERFPQFQFSVSSTTREKKPSEVDGIDYEFLKRENFEVLVRAKDFLEHEEVHGQLYGTRKSLVEKMLDVGTPIIFDLDVLGALSIKRNFPEALTLYIDVPSIEELRRRLEKRGRESNDEIERRLARYLFERSMSNKFDAVILNEDLETAVSEVLKKIEDYLDSSH